MFPYGKYIATGVEDCSGVYSVSNGDFFNPSLFAICTKYNEQMEWFIDRDGGEETSVALFCIQKVQCLEWL
jgi:hypothetical protein